MRLLLDTCVLYPTVMRSVLLGAAKAGFFQPLWSDRILEEWARAARKIGPTGEVQARGEIAVVQAQWPKARVSDFQGLERRLWLPDPNDIHILAAAIKSSADAIVTFNTKDFPKRILQEEGLDRIDPDTLLFRFFQDDPKTIGAVVDLVKAEADRLGNTDWDTRALLKKARLPRLGKAISG